MDNNNRMMQDDLRSTASALSERILTNTHLKAENLTTFDGFRGAKILKRGLTKIEKSFEKKARKLVKLHNKEVKAKVQNVALIDRILADAITYKKYADFFREDARLVQLSIDEYRTYLYSGHFIQAIFGKERDKEDFISLENS